MASNNDSRQHYVNLCQFRELFSGRFDDEEAAFILEHFSEDVQAAINFVLASEPSEVRRIIEEERDSWQTVLTATKKQNVVEKIANLRQNPRVLARAVSGQIDTLLRMFSCRTCDLFWWRRVPERKKVSKCTKCRKRYDPLPRDEEWGWAEFLCSYCGHQFAGWCGMWYSSPCYNCQALVFPTRIVPPLRHSKRQQRSMRNRHHCGAPDCIGVVAQLPVGPPQMVQGESGKLLPITCVYPANRRARNLPVVVLPSDAHDSTGSTVNTFLPQNDLTRAFEIIPMAAIDENDSEND